MVKNDILIKCILSFDLEDINSIKLLRTYLKELDAPAFLNYLYKQKIAGIVADRLKRLEIYAELNQELVQALDKHLRALSIYNDMAIDELKRFVEEVKSPVYIVKGIAFECGRIYPSGVRAVGDLDVVMPYPACVKAWENSAASNSYEPEEMFLSQLHKRILSQYPSFEHHHLPALRSATYPLLTVEIHPQVYNPSMGVTASAEKVFPQYSSKAFLNAVPIEQIPGCFQLAAEDHLLFVCFHLMDNWKNGELTWRMICDVHALIQANPALNWGKCVHIAKNLDLYPTFMRALSIVNSYLFIPVPVKFVLHFEYMENRLSKLNERGLGHIKKVSLRKRLAFYLRHMQLHQAILYMYKTLFPDRAYIQKQYAQKYKAGGLISGTLFHILSKSKQLLS